MLKIVVGKMNLDVSGKMSDDKSFNMIYKRSDERCNIDREGALKSRTMILLIRGCRFAQIVRSTKAFR